MKRKRHQTLLIALGIVAGTSFTAMAEEQNGAPSESVQNTLTDKEKSEGWSLLFDGKTTQGWHVFQQPDATPAWEVKDGMLTVDLRANKGQHGDLATNQEFDNYELKFEWKTTADGNSGVFINVQEDPEHMVAWQTGPEYQLLGASHVDFEKVVKRSGCLYGYAPQLTDTNINDVNEWNQSLIKQKDGKVEFYLNGTLTAKVDLGSEDWKSWVAQSGFKAFPDFGAATKGHFVLQEWSSPVWFRNIKVREI